MRSLHLLKDDAEAERFIPEISTWVHDAGNPYYDWFLGGPERASEILAGWMKRGSSEISIRRAALLDEDGRILGGFIALDGAQLAKCRQADMLALFTKMGSDKQFENRMKSSQSLFQKVEPDDFYLSKIGVGVDSRGKGLGREIMAEYLAAGKKAGLRRFRLDVSASNLVAVRLYQSFGFEIVGQSSIPETEIEYLAMTKPVEP